MALRFRGTSTHKVDAKGRVSIPADFRRVLDREDPDRDPGTNPRVVILHGDTRNPWMDCYSVDAMERMEDAMDEMDEGDPARLALEEYFCAFADTLTIDDSGRLILSRDMRDRFGIEGEATFQARGRRFRIFSPEAPVQVTSRLAGVMAELPADVPITSLLPSKSRAEPAG